MWNGDAVRLTELPPDEPKLPYDAEVEYLESDGARWIDTGVDLAVDGKFDGEVMFYGSAATTKTRWSSGQTVNFSGVTSNRFRFGYLGNYELAYIWFANTSFGTKRKSDNFVRVILDAMTGYKCFGTYSDTTIPIWDTQTTGLTHFWVFATCEYRDGVISPLQPATMRLAWVKLSKSGVLVRDFIPVRVGGVGYLYDRANPTGGPLGNGLYGDFSDGKGGVTGFPANLVGPDKPKP